jgi:hypothetical protein
VIELVKVPDNAPSVVFVASVISGFGLAPQTKPAVVMVAPPVLLTVPPPKADVAVIDVGVVVAETVGVVCVVKLVSAP